MQGFFSEFCDIFKSTFLKNTSGESCAEFSEKLIFLTRAYQEGRNVSFSEYFAYVLNGWPLIRLYLEESYNI